MPNTKSSHAKQTKILGMYTQSQTQTPKEKEEQAREHHLIATTTTRNTNQKCAKARSRHNAIRDPI
jgi:hypothetical protein